MCRYTYVTMIRRDNVKWWRTHILALHADDESNDTHQCCPDAGRCETWCPPQTWGRESVPATNGANSYYWWGLPINMYADAPSCNLLCIISIACTAAVRTISLYVYTINISRWRNYLHMAVSRLCSCPICCNRWSGLQPESPDLRTAFFAPNIGLEFAYIGSQAF